MSTVVTRFRATFSRSLVNGEMGHVQGDGLSPAPIPENALYFEPTRADCRSSWNRGRPLRQRAAKTGRPGFEVGPALRPSSSSKPVSAAPRPTRGGGSGDRRVLVSTYKPQAAAKPSQQARSCPSGGPQPCDVHSIQLTHLTTPMICPNRSPSSTSTRRSPR
jgi:hypothetical protein